VHQGAALEDRLMEQSRLLLHRDVELIYIPPRFKILPGRTSGGFLKCCPQKSSWVDFIAEWGGPSVHFDAKSTTGSDNFHIDDRIQGHQGEILKRQARRGKVTFVYVRRIKPVGFDDYVIPYGEEGFPFSNKSSIVWSKLEKWKMPAGFCWFDAVPAWAQYVELGWGAAHTKMGYPLEFKPGSPPPAPARGEG
jgi:hypothetical protein